MNRHEKKVYLELINVFENELINLNYTWHEGEKIACINALKEIGLEIARGKKVNKKKKKK